MFKRKLYFKVYTEKSNLFSLNGYVLTFKDKNCTKLLYKYDLETFYTFVRYDKKLDLICLGGENIK